MRVDHASWYFWVSYDTFRGVFQVYSAVYIGGEFIQMWNFGENIIKFRFYLYAEFSEFWLCGKDFDLLSDGHNGFDRFDRFEFVLYVLCQLLQTTFNSLILLPIAHSQVAKFWKFPGV